MTLESANPNSDIQKIWVSDLNIGDKVKSVFQVTRINLREYDKGKFLTLRLGDRTGKVTAVLWDRAEEVYQTLKEGDLAIAEGRVGKYQQEIQFKLYSILKVEDLSLFNIADFLPVSPIPVQDLEREFDEAIKSIGDADYKTLLELFRSDESIWSKYSKAPGAKRWHHPYLHGLLDHTLSVVKVCQRIAPLYPDINADLLITGAIFHDCGKMEEYIYQTQIDFSTEGRLLGHLFQGAILVNRLMEQIPDFPQAKRIQLLHIIASHHGEIERSPVLPMTMEACLLHHIENMDAQMAAIRREMKAAQKENREWTGYINLMDRALYLGENNEPSDNSDE